MSQPPPRPVPGFTLEETIQLLKPTAFMVDAVVETPEGTYIIEAKTDNESQAIGQLLFYQFLMKRYAALQDVDVTRTRPTLLFARRNADLEEFANDLGVIVAYYSPDWIQEFLRMGYTKG